MYCLIIYLSSNFNAQATIWVFIATNDSILNYLLGCKPRKIS